MKYAVFPDYVKSKSDGDEHYITGDMLIHLYDVDPNECVVIDDRNNQRIRVELMRLAEEDKLIQLRPRYDGNYIVPEGVA